MAREARREREASEAQALKERAVQAEQHAQEQRQSASKLKRRAVAAAIAAGAALPIFLALSILEINRGEDCSEQCAKFGDGGY